MSIRITHRRMSQSGGTQHEHIVSVRWVNEATSVSDSSTVAAIVDFIDGDGKAFVSNGWNRVEVGVVRPRQGAPYIRTYANGVWTDNLLSLPTY